ncbi:MAG TPA: sigma-70 family RNA polymerase sigma factor [Longimicrobium sp.]|uniref:RNA polymerase sigma factor n=1 Tax=Longimicrobium sp. TaxID=2029185 RepID=UPI002ED7A71D
MSFSAPVLAMDLAPARAPAAPAVDDEPALVEGVRRGDPAAFDALAGRYMRCAFAVAYRLLGNREDAEDLVQDAFMAVLRKIDSFQRGRSFSPWFLRILVNRGLNARKARALRTTDEIPDAAAASGASPERHAEQAEVRDRLRAALAGLPERQRIIVELFELEGFASTEIAEILEIADGTVRWHLHEARKALRQALAAYDRREG